MYHLEPPPTKIGSGTRYDGGGNDGLCTASESTQLPALSTYLGAAQLAAGLVAIIVCIPRPAFGALGVPYWAGRTPFVCGNIKLPPLLPAQPVLRMIIAIPNAGTARFKKNTLSSVVA